MRPPILAVIPARGGSKRLPGKNVMPFLGRPMLAHTIEAARASGRFGRIVVSTDDAAIARTAAEAGVEVPFLRAVHADDHAPISAATIAAVEQATAHFGETYGTVVQLMPNCPLRDAGAVGEMLDAFESAGHDFMISAFRFSWMNPWWAVTLDPGGHPTRLFPEVGDSRSQDLAPLYCPSGAVWIARWPALREAGTFYGPGHVFHDIGWERAVDIDDREDLVFAQAVAVARAVRAGAH